MLFLKYFKLFAFIILFSANTGLFSVVRAEGNLDAIEVIGNQFTVQGWVATQNPSQTTESIIIKFDDKTVY